jgi:hypothetical protein
MSGNRCRYLSLLAQTNILSKVLYEASSFHPCYKYITEGSFGSSGIDLLDNSSKMYKCSLCQRSAILNESRSLTEGFFNHMASFGERNVDPNFDIIISSSRVTTL